MPEDPRLNRFFKVMYLERGLLLSGAGLACGIGLLVAAVYQWKLAGFGQLDYARTMRFVVPGATLTAISFQTILSSFFVSILGMRRR
jgi:F0F1-type ATP synthase membrane subunit c/vacuolar-type H+-ATPase subunit K